MKPFAYWQAAASGSFDPSTLANLSLYCHVSSLALSNGAAVNSWTPITGSAPTASGSERPTYNSSLGGKACVQFDGAANLMTLASNLSGSGDFTVFVKQYRASTGDKMLSLGCGALVPMAPMQFNDGNIYWANQSSYGSSASTLTGWNYFVFKNTSGAMTVRANGSNISFSPASYPSANNFDRLGLRGSDLAKGGIICFGYVARSINSTETTDLETFLAAQ